MATRSSTSKDVSVKDMTTTFLSVLDNDEVIAKLGSILAASINLILDEKITPMVKKLENVITENKALHTRISNVELENGKLKQLSDGLQTSLDTMATRVNQLEQTARGNNIIITGIAESFAERADENAAVQDGATPQQASREDTINSVCKVIHDACNVDVTPNDLRSAHRLRSKRPGPRPILVTFNSLSLRTSVVNARRPKQQLKFRGSNIYINDHLTKLNADLAHNARQLVKSRDSYSTWVREGQVFVKWSQDSRPTHIQRMADFD